MSEALTAAVCCGAAAAAIIVAVILRRRVVKMTGSIERTIDAMLEGAFESGCGMYDDTLTARINAKLARLYEIMERRGEQSRAQHARMQELVSDISHQVKTPMANIRMLNETLAGGVTPEKRAELQSQLDAQVAKLDFLVQALVKSSRLEAGAVKLTPRRAPVMETLARAVGGVALQAENKNIEINVDCGDIYAAHDPKWTAEALLNILDNAVKYTPEGGGIDIACEQWEVYTKISVSDTGPGIAEGERAQVFGRFYRSPSVQQQEGIGIGLYLAREILRQQGGYIKATSKPGEGSVFSVFIPNS